METQPQVDASSSSSGEGEKVVLVYGSTGWIGSQLVKMFSSLPNVRVVCGRSRLENLPDLSSEIAESGAQFVVNAAAAVGFPTVNWCEDHKQQTLLTNVAGSINVAEACLRVSRTREGPPVHLTYFGSGCIYNYDEDHPVSGRPFTEDEPPNFKDSFYSLTKHAADTFLREYENVLNLRLRLPACSEFHRKNLVVKLAGYKQLINIPNSISVLDDLLPLSLDMTMRRITGTFNFVNPGVITHNEILSFYRQYVDENHSWENFTVEEQDEMLKVKRCNVHLDTTKLSTLYPQLPDIKTSMERIIKEMASKPRLSQ